MRCDHVRADRQRRLLNVQGKMCVGRRKARHFCITTTSQIIGAAALPPRYLRPWPVLQRLVNTTS